VGARRAVEVVARFTNVSRDILDSVRLLLRIPVRAICLRGELRREIPRLMPGAVAEIPLVLEFDSPGFVEFTAQVAGRNFEKDLRFQCVATIAVAKEDIGAAATDSGLECAVSLKRQDSLYEVHAKLSGPGGSLVDEVKVDGTPQPFGATLSAGVPIQFSHRFPIPVRDESRELHFGYRNPQGIRRQLAVRVGLPGKEARAMLFVAANPGGESEARDFNGLPGRVTDPPGWLQTEREFRYLDESTQSSACIHLSRPCLAASYQSLLQHLLRERPRLLHFAGHGTERHLVLHADDHSALPVSAAAIHQAVQVLSRPLDLIVLNACHAFETGLALRPLASRVIATRGKLPDAAAVAFVRAFYTALAADLMVDPDAIARAFQVGRGAVEAAGHGPATYELIA